MASSLAQLACRWWFVALAASGCNPRAESPLQRVEFGVMFGGQYQVRLEVPFELDVTKQALGFFIRLKQPAPTPTPVHWELSKPGPSSNGLSNPLSRRTELFDAVLPAGQLELRQPVSMNPGDQLGTWNIRVVVGNHVAIDRPFWVFDADVRRQKPLVDAGNE